MTIDVLRNLPSTSNFQIDKENTDAESSLRTRTRNFGHRLQSGGSGWAIKGTRRKTGGFHLGKGPNGEWVVRDNAGNVTGRIGWRHFTERSGSRTSQGRPGCIPHL